MRKPLKKINVEKVEKEELVAPEGTKYTITIEDKVAFLCQPSRKVFSEVLPLMSEAFGGTIDMVAAGEIILLKCFIGGDIEMKTEDEYILPAALQCLKLFNLKEAELKEN